MYYNNKKQAGLYSDQNCSFIKYGKDQF